jgi:hypothetical protein
MKILVQFNDNERELLQKLTNNQSLGISFKNLEFKSSKRDGKIHGKIEFVDFDNRSRLYFEIPHSESNEPIVVIDTATIEPKET